MTRRPSTETIGPCAELITRRGRYRWRSRSAASSSPRKASGSGRAVGAHHCVQSMMTLPESPERAAANAASKSRNPKRWVIAGPDVEPRLEHHRHLVPGLVHLATVDPPQRQHLEDDRVEVEGDLLGRDAEERDPAAMGHLGERIAQRRGIAGHLERDVEALDHAELAPATSPRSRSRGSTAIVAPIRTASSRRNGFGSETTTWRAPAWRTTAVAISPIGPAPDDEDVLAQDRERQRGVDRVAERVEDRGDLLVDARPRGARCWSSAGRRIRRTLRRARPRDRCVWAHRWRRPARQWRHRPHTTWPSPETRSPGWKSYDVAADLDDLADELVADDERRIDRLSPPMHPTTRCAGPCRRCRSCGPASRTSLIPGRGSGTSSQAEARARPRSSRGRASAWPLLGAGG